jgi:tRNA A-37 threonylcarbamoyl transferase component Bud32
MRREGRVDTLRPGNVFRDWLIDVLQNRIRNKRCDVAVYKLAPASHTVCRYEFLGEGYNVVAKFYAEPTGWKKDYDPGRSMNGEFDKLKRLESIINVPRPIAARWDFHSVLVTEYVRGKPLFKFMKSERGLYDRLTALAQNQRRLHDHTRSDYFKQDEFARFHQVLDQLRLDPETRLLFNRLLGDWWYSTLLDQPHGCMVHGDPNPVNCIFDHDRVYFLDFESSREHANCVHDLGIVAAELKHYFAIHKGNDKRAESYIGHFLWHYSRSEDEFRRITRALPFFMSLGLLRMARLKLGPQDSSYVFREATACLRARH